MLGSHVRLPLATGPDRQRRRLWRGAGQCPGSDPGWRLATGGCGAEDLGSPDQDGDQQHQRGESGHADCHVNKQQAAGDDSSHQQPDCDQDNRQYGAKPDHA
ncbi:MAG TPA: hypothetical protein VN840_22540 [Streptosporangiaceae bacterium]|nr:hypothetical protein [Streptosporangiaceae bacterium]